MNVVGQDWGALKRCRDIIERGDLSNGLRGDGMADFYDCFGRYWYLRPIIYKTAEWIRSSTFTPEILQTFDVLWHHVRGATETVHQDMEKFAGTFPARLLKAGFTKAETNAQVADALFAGVETTGFNLGSLIWHLVQNPAVYQRLRKEVTTAGSIENTKALSYLNSVVYEGLRISDANPTRFPRVVPDSGWFFKGSHLPAGFEVSCTPHQLHFNPDVYRDPERFLPERWLDATDEMRRDWIPFSLGARRCIAKDLAMMELQCALFALAEADALAGAVCSRDKIELLEWFSVEAVGGTIDLEWK
jgi:hypothetical protein